MCYERLCCASPRQVRPWLDPRTFASPPGPPRLHLWLTFPTWPCKHLSFLPLLERFQAAFSCPHQALVPLFLRIKLCKMRCAEPQNSESSAPRPSEAAPWGQLLIPSLCLSATVPSISPSTQTTPLPGSLPSTPKRRLRALLPFNYEVHSSPSALTRVS